jgi:hypothetical protein
MIPHEVQTMRGPKAGTGIASQNAFHIHHRFVVALYEMRETMVHSLSNYLRQRIAPWSQETGKPKSCGHRSPAMLCGNTHDDRRPIRKRGLEDVVVRAGAEATHVDRRTSDRGGCQIARDGVVWCVGRHSRVCQSSGAG